MDNASLAGRGSFKRLWSSRRERERERERESKLRKG